LGQGGRPPESLGVSALGDEDVGRLDVAVEDATGVRSVHGAGDLYRQLQLGR
jgi:hypothetical protein